MDYDNAIVPVNNSFYRILHKRLSFAHECELRAVIWSFEDINAPLIPRGSPFASIDIEPSALIHAVYVSPTAPDWFGVLVERLLARYGLSCLVERSKLYERPTY